MGTHRTGERYLKGMESGQRWFLAVQFISDGSERVGLSAYSMKAGQHWIAVYVRAKPLDEASARRSFSRLRTPREARSLEIHSTPLGAVPF
jgi:hypothetical protein